MKRRSLLQISTALSAAGMITEVLSQPSPNAYPSRPIELVVSFGAGGGTDSVARSLAEGLRTHLSQPVTVNNKPGASGSIGMTDVANSPPDGYKLILLTVESTILTHIGIGKVSHLDFTPIARLNFDPSAITVRADAPWNTLEEFMDAVRKSPSTISVGNAGPGSIWHVAATALEAKANVKVNHIPFQGAGPAVLALAGGHVDAVAVSPAEVTTLVQAGKLKVLGVMADQRVKGFEKIPTFKERGIDLKVGAWRGIAGPKGLPANVVSTLFEAVRLAVNEPVYREALDKLNLGPAYADAATFKTMMDQDSQNFKALVAKIELKS
jgi:tripartite-type tricarboxylate transporter receptor subunit TctC